MNLERSILVAFLGSYLVNTVLSMLVYLIPGALADTRAGFASPYYILYVVLSVLLIAGITWWYMRSMSKAGGLIKGIMFGVIGFAVIVITTLLSGISSMLFQTGSLAGIGTALSGFWALMFSLETLVLLLEWLIPAAFIGWWMERKAPRSTQM